MSLRESQNFFYHLMARPEVIAEFKKDRKRVLKKFFRSEKDRLALSKLPFERFETYRKHISIGLLGGLKDAFPVIRSLVSEKEWTALLNDFYLKRLTRSPIARHVFREFSHYLQKKYRGPLRKRLPYLQELAEYENADLRLLYDADRPVSGLLVIDLSSIRDPSCLLGLVPVLNPHHVLRVYRWPVHRICREFSSLKKVRPGRHPLLIYREPVSFRVKFLELNPLTAELLKKTESGRLTIENLIEGLARTCRPMSLEAFVIEAMGIFQILQDKGVLLGYRKI